MAPLLLFQPINPAIWILPAAHTRGSLSTYKASVDFTFLYSFRFPYPYRQSPPLPDPTPLSPQLGLLGANVLTAFVVLNRAHPFLGRPGRLRKPRWFKAQPSALLSAPPRTSPATGALPRLALAPTAQPSPAPCPRLARIT